MCIRDSLVYIPQEVKVFSAGEPLPHLGAVRDKAETAFSCEWILHHIDSDVYKRQVENNTQGGEVDGGSQIK